MYLYFVTTTERGRKLMDTGAERTLLHSIMADRLYLFYGFMCQRQYTYPHFVDRCVLFTCFGLPYGNSNCCGRLCLLFKFHITFRVIKAARITTHSNSSQNYLDFFWTILCFSRKVRNFINFNWFSNKLFVNGISWAGKTYTFLRMEKLRDRQRRGFMVKHI